MLRTTGVSVNAVDTSRGGVPRSAALAGIAVAGMVGLMVAWIGFQVLVVRYLAPLRVDASVAHVSGGLRLDDPVDVAVSGYGTRLVSAQLFRSDVTDPGSSPLSGNPVAVVATGTGEGTWRLVSPDGSALLRPDGNYRLLVDVAAPGTGFPTFVMQDVESQYQFTTVPGPHPNVPAQALPVRWGAGVPVDWTMPLVSVQATVNPPAPLNSFVDPNNQSRTWFEVDPSATAGGQSYTISITAATGIDGTELQKPASVVIQTPARPAFTNLSPDPVSLTPGSPLHLTASVPLAAAHVETSDGSHADVSLAGTDMTVALPDAGQGQSFDVRILDATSDQGAPLARPAVVHVATPDPLGAPAISPADGASAVATSAHPSVTFPDPVADPTAAQKALSIDPPVPGQWHWTSPTVAQFIPTSALANLKDYEVTVHGGPDGPRSASGGYLPADVSASFETVTDKSLDVNLTHQTMTLLQNGVPVRTINVATGVAAAPTPVGTYSVEYKMAQARFAGFNPDGSHYDIPDVNWVMPFSGDYTIHGAYWRPQFGVPGSDGCVSMSDADAKFVFDWADVGSPVVIHN